MLKAKTAILRAAGLLLGSTVAAQAITLLSLPLVTRLYSPSDFGAFATYSAIVGTAGVIACGRMELAIPLPADKNDARDIGATALAILVIFSAITLVICLCVWLAFDRIPLFVLLVPLGVFSAGLLSIGQYLLIRAKNFTVVAKARIVQSLVSSCVQIIGGIAPIGAWGLYSSQVGGNVAAFLVQSSIEMRLSNCIHAISRLTVFRMLSKYKDYWRYSAPEALTNTAAIQAPLVLIAANSSTQEAGYLLLAMKLLQIPVSLVAGSISQVYYAHSAEKEREGVLPEFTGKILSSIAQIGIGPIIFAAIVSPQLIPLIFGDSWVKAGALVPWLTGWFTCQLLASPISTVMQTKGLQKEMLKITSFGFLTRTGVVIGAILFFPEFQSIAYGLSGLVFYLVCLVIFCNAADIGLSRARSIIFRSIPWIFPWVFGGATLCFLIRRFAEL